MRAYAPHKRAIVQPGRFNLRDFLRKKTNFELAAMHSASSEGGMLRLSYDLEPNLARIFSSMSELTGPSIDLLGP